MKYNTHRRSKLSLCTVCVECSGCKDANIFLLAPQSRGEETVCIPTSSLILFSGF